MLVPKISGPKIFGSVKFFSLIDCGCENNLVHKFDGPKLFLVHNNFGSDKFLIKNIGLKIDHSVH